MTSNTSHLPYTGPTDEVVCQFPTSKDHRIRCLRSVAPYGPVKVAGAMHMLYRCSMGHAFAVLPIPSAGDLSGAVVVIMPSVEKAIFGARL